MPLDHYHFSRSLPGYPTASGNEEAKKTYFSGCHHDQSVTGFQVMAQVRLRVISYFSGWGDGREQREWGSIIAKEDENITLAIKTFSRD